MTQFLKRPDPKTFKETSDSSNPGDSFCPFNRKYMQRPVSGVHCLVDNTTILLHSTVSSFGKKNQSACKVYSLHRCVLRTSAFFILILYYLPSSSANRLSPRWCKNHWVNVNPSKIHFNLLNSWFYFSINPSQEVQS